ncbi:hypothetical protein EON82_03580 [bacterium]|nr:MAG: hypothetical protein EON82_03580 [bacterium]
MNLTIFERLQSRALAVVAASALALPLIGCGSGTPSGVNQAPIDASRPMGYSTQTMPTQAPRQGMSTGKKVMLLAGAAALYYMYKKNQEKKAAGQLNGQPQYYLSKNGRVYYRDNTGRAVWVTPPPQGIQVPYDEAQQYSQFQGYNNQTSGYSDLSRFAGSGMGGY